MQGIPSIYSMQSLKAKNPLTLHLLSRQCFSWQQEKGHWSVVQAAAASVAQSGPRGPEQESNK